MGTTRTICHPSFISHSNRTLAIQTLDLRMRLWPQLPISLASVPAAAGGTPGSSSLQHTAHQPKDRTDGGTASWTGLAWRRVTSGSTSRGPPSIISTYRTHVIRMMIHFSS